MCNANSGASAALLSGLVDAHEADTAREGDNGYEQERDKMDASYQAI